MPAKHQHDAADHHGDPRGEAALRVALLALLELDQQLGAVVLGLLGAGCIAVGLTVRLRFGRSGRGGH